MRAASLLTIAAVLATHSPLIQAQQQTGVRWRAFNPSTYENGQTSPWFVRDLRDGWRNDAPSEVFWVKLIRSGDSFGVREVSPVPVARDDINEEVLVVDAARRLAHPAYLSLPDERAPRGGVPCEPEIVANAQLYNLCNSAFGAATSAPVRLLIGILSGGQTEIARSKARGEPKSYEPDLLVPVVRSQEFAQILDAELPKARAKQKELITAQQRVVQQAQVDEAARRQAENDSARAKFEVEKAAAIAKLRNQRRGYKDVCSYLRSSLSRGSNLAMEPLQCVNMGTVQSMEAAKAAGFIVTAIQGTATDPTFNLEKFD